MTKFDKIIENIPRDNQKFNLDNLISWLGRQLKVSVVKRCSNTIHPFIKSLDKGSFFKD